MPASPFVLATANQEDDNDDDEQETDGAAANPDSIGQYGCEERMHGVTFVAEVDDLPTVVSPRCAMV